MDWMVNYIQLAWKLACMLRIYRTCNSMAGFSKYEFYNKLLGGVILLRVTPGVTWTQPYIYIDTHAYDFPLPTYLEKKKKKNHFLCF